MHLYFAYCVIIFRKILQFKINKNLMHEELLLEEIPGLQFINHWIMNNIPTLGKAYLYLLTLFLVSSYGWMGQRLSSAHLSNTIFAFLITILYCLASIYLVLQEPNTYCTILLSAIFIIVPLIGKSLLLKSLSLNTKGPWQFTNDQTLGLLLKSVNIDAMFGQINRNIVNWITSLSKKYTFISNLTKGKGSNYGIGSKIGVIEITFLFTLLSLGLSLLLLGAVILVSSSDACISNTAFTVLSLVLAVVNYPQKLPFARQYYRKDINIKRLFIIILDHWKRITGLIITMIYTKEHLSTNFQVLVWITTVIGPILVDWIWNTTGKIQWIDFRSYLFTIPSSLKYLSFLGIGIYEGNYPLGFWLFISIIVPTAYNAIKYLLKPIFINSITKFLLQRVEPLYWGIGLTISTVIMLVWWITKGCYCLTTHGLIVVTIAVSIQICPRFKKQEKSKQKQLAGPDNQQKIKKQ